MTDAREYLWIWFWWTVVLLANVAALNLVVDPYGLFRVIDVPGLNRLKSQASERGPLFKHTGVARMQPRALILGNSRAEIGFDPESPAWPEWARPAFNLALPGAAIGAVAGDFGRALHATHPRLVVVGLDFVDFRVDPSAQDGFTLAVPAADPWRDFRDRCSALLTMGSFADSLATVRAQHEPFPTGLTDAGFNPKRDYLAIARREGYFALFQQRDQENALNYWRGPKTVFRTGTRSSAAFEAVDSIVALARSRGIAVRLVIYPYHAHTLTLFHLADLWPAFEEWKRELARRIDAARSTMDIELWDFSGFAPYADELIPPPGDVRTELKWYWEAGHFKKELGDMLLGEILLERTDGERWGRRLTEATFEEHIERQRAARDAYERTYPADVAALSAMIRSAALR
jgi:hypothetical protein